MATDHRELMDALTSTIQELNTLSVIVEDFQPTSQTVVFDKLNGYIKSLEQIDSLRTQMGSVEIPTDILKYVSIIHDIQLVYNSCLMST